jgi:hypothetical protein
MSGESGMVYMLAGAASLGVSFLVQLVFIIVVATLVRRHRPDVSPILLLALGVEALVSLGTYAAQVLVPRLLLPDATHYAQALALLGLMGALGHAIGRGLLLWGVVRLATPAGAPP